MRRNTLTVGILTLNESKRIQACIESVQFADQVLVIDSGSSDDTVAIAKRCGAQVHDYADWKGFAVQRNRLLQHATGDYIFFLDADEQLPAAGQTELEKILISGEEAVWKIRWRMVAFGQELTHLRSTSLVERIFKRDMLIEFQGVVHEQAILRSKIVPRHVLKTSVLHFSRDTVRDALEKLTQYSILGAKKRLDSGKQGGVLRGLLSGSAMFFRL
ncbi:MAG: glycosyltransferase family 2 protein, partial [Comamonas sp.]